MQKDRKKPYQAMALMSAILSQLVGSILIGIFLGKYLDKVFETNPLFLIIGLFIGLATGTLGTIKIIKHFNGENS